MAILVALALSFPAFSVPVAAGDEAPGPASGPHLHFRNPGSCPGCHVRQEAGFSPDRFVQRADAVCLGCHSSEGLGTSHPTTVRPADVRGGMTVPGDLRLDDGGRVICVTCHSAHGPFLSPTRSFPSQAPESPDAEAGGKRLYRTYFARRSDPVRGFAPLCEACHGKR